MRRPDTAARVGGDEFVVVCHDVAGEDAVMGMVDRIKSAIEEPLTIEGESFALGASIGIVVTRSRHENPDELLRAADMAMYEAKQRGTGHHENYDDTLRARAVARVEIERDLRQALDQGLLSVHYQPIVDLRDGSTSGVEALVRMRHPTRGILRAEQFLNVAETSGLIVPIGGFVAQDACRWLAAWQCHLRTPLSMHVNISGREILQDGLCDRLAAAIATAGVDPCLVTIEITEIDYSAMSSSFLADLFHLTERGVRIALDDFGTGYSSLVYLERFPIDVVKIGRRFVAGLGSNPRDSAIVLDRQPVPHARHHGHGRRCRDCRPACPPLRSRV